MYNVHTQSLKIRIEDESKSFLCFQRNCGLRELESSYSQVLTNCCIGGKKLENHTPFFSVCAYSEGGNEITCRRSKSKGKKNVRELGQDLQENVPFLRTKCIVGKKVAFSRNCYPNGKRTYQVCFETWCPLFQMKFKIVFYLNLYKNHETFSVDFQRLCSTWLTLSNAEILRQRDLHNHMSAVRFLA